MLLPLQLLVLRERNPSPFPAELVAQGRRLLRECLRLTPPAGGGFRISTEPITIAGFDIEPGMCVTADPRISNAMESLHAQPAAFEPLRWVDAASPPAKASTSCAAALCGAFVYTKDGPNAFVCAESFGWVEYSRG